MAPRKPRDAGRIASTPDAAETGLTLVTTCGAVHNAYWSDIQSEVTLDDLFRDD